MITATSCPCAFRRSLWCFRTTERTTETSAISVLPRCLQARVCQIVPWTVLAPPSKTSRLSCPRIEQNSSRDWVRIETQARSRVGPNSEAQLVKVSKNCAMGKGDTEIRMMSLAAYVAASTVHTTCKGSSSAQRSSSRHRSSVHWQR